MSREGFEVIFDWAFGGNNPAKARPVWVFPPPDSPISAVIFPVGIVKEIWSLANSLGYSEFTTSFQSPIYDDHRALYLNSNIPAIDIIDFDYPFCHTLEDVTKNCSEKTLKIVGNVVCEFIYRKDYENK